MGGIHVATDNQENVVKAIQAYWTKIGARALTRNPLEVAPLSLAKTAELAFAVAPATKMPHQGPSWVAIYDSERYRADPALARHLAKTLNTTVIFWKIGHATNAAYAKVYGTGEVAIKQGLEDIAYSADIEHFIETELPYPFLYFNFLKEASQEDIKKFSIFGFEQVPYRSHAQYRGPSPKEQRLLDVQKDVEALVKAYDQESLRTLYNHEEEQVRDFLLSLVASLDPFHKKARSIILEFAEEILASKKYFLVEAVTATALLENEVSLFKKSVASLGSQISTMESFAHHLLEQKMPDLATAMLREICADSGAKGSSWNNLAYALFHAKELPADAKSLLARADAHGMANPPIFHNTACAWLRMKERDNALTAVENAAKAGYTQLVALKTDTDLAKLWEEPRFLAAFAPGSSTASLDDLVVTTQHRGALYMLARPVLEMTFFLKPIAGTQTGPALAQLMETVLNEIPSNVLTSYNAHGPWKSLTKGKITRDRNALRKASDETFVSLSYRGETDLYGGAPSPYGIDIELWGQENGDKAEHVPFVQCWFPAERAKGRPEEIVAQFLRYAALVPYEAGTCGLVQKLRASSYLETWWDHELVLENGERFLGFNQSPRRQWKAGCAPGASWLTLLDAQLLTKLGGEKALEKAVGTAKLTHAPHQGICIQASYQPAVGIPPTPKDLGALPQVSRALATLRPADEPSYARLDHLSESPWDNHPSL